MHITWVPKKKIDPSLIQTLLEPSVTSGQLTNGGPAVQYLEETIKELLEIDDSKAVICVCSGTAALHALVAGINLYHHGELRWVTQSFTFPASAQGSLRYSEIVDIDAGGGLDLSMVKDCDGIIVSNIFGNIVDIDRYIAWGEENSKIVIFDNAATPYTFYKGKNAMNYGVGGIISFHHTKPIGFGEGGAAIVDKKYEKHIRRCINFGIDNTTGDRWDRWGSNYKMSDIQAVYISMYMDNFNDIINHHQKLLETLIELLADTDIKMYPNYSDCTRFLSCFCLLSPRFNLDFIASICAQGVQCQKYYRPLMKTPVATKIYDQIICIPCTIDMTIQDIHLIVDLIR